MELSRHSTQMMCRGKVVKTAREKVHSAANAASFVHGFPEGNPPFQPAHFRALIADGLIGPRGAPSDPGGGGEG